MFPVEVKYTNWMEEYWGTQAVKAHKMEEKCAEVIKDALEERPGDVLVFLPGEKEIMYVWIYLNNNWGIGDGKIPRGMAAFAYSIIKRNACDSNSGISAVP